MTACDTLISARWVLPIAPENTVLEDHAIAITDGRIAAIGPADELAQTYAANEALTLGEHILMPGLVNAHGHSAMTLLRGAGEDQSLQDWLTETIWPLEGRLMNAEFVELGTMLAIHEMLSTGTTTFADMYFFPDVIARLADKTGIRARVAFPVIEMANVWSENVDDGIHKGLALYDDYRHHPRVEMMFGPHAAYTVNPENLAKVAMYANEIDACVQIHLHENRQEVEEALAKTGKTWIRTLSEQNLLGPNLQAVHMTEVSDEDLELIAESQSRVIHCPISNLKLASGYCDIERMLEAGVIVGLGTDGAASNNSLDLFHEARMASLLAKHQRQDPRSGRAPHLLHMATLGGAQALGLGHEIGSLEVGKQADVIAINTARSGMHPVHDPFAAILHGPGGSAVEYTFVAGECLLQESQCTSINATELLNEVQTWQKTKFVA